MSQDWGSTAKDVFDNSTVAFNPTNSRLVMGNAQVIAAEVALSKVIRWFLKVPKRSILDLATVHTVSQTFLGGFSGYFNQSQPLANNPSTMTALQDGAKGIPGLLFAQYIVNTAYNGLHFPKWTFKEFLILGASKALTRPIINMAYSSLPVTVQQNFNNHDLMVQRQNVVTRLQ